MSALGQVRLPLQIGTSSLWSLARCSATLLPGLGLVPIAFLAMASNVRLGFGVLVIAGLLVFFAVMHIVLSVRHRPSDVVLSKEGLQIEGGPHAGHRYGWPDIAPDPSQLFDAQERRITILGIVRSILTRDGEYGMTDVRVLKLQMALTDGRTLLLAEAERPIEQESLRALHESLSSGSWRGSGGARARGKSAGPEPTTRTLACPSCGAAVAPDDKPVARCRFCNAEVPVPAETQQRVRAARDVSGARAVTERLVTGLLEQPGASRVNRLLLFYGAPMMLVWPIAFVVGAVRGLLRHIDPVDFLWLALFPMATILALFFLLRAQLVDRQALKLLTLNFGAKEPEKPGDPYTCRSCRGPLPESHDKVVVRCAYCNADNILGLDLRRDAAPATDEAKGLEQAVVERGRERLLWRFLTGVAGVLLLVGVGSLVLGLGVTPLEDATTPATPAATTTVKPVVPAHPGAPATRPPPASAPAPKPKAGPAKTK